MSQETEAATARQMDHIKQHLAEAIDTLTKEGFVVSAMRVINKGELAAIYLEVPPLLEDES